MTDIITTDGEYGFKMNSSKGKYYLNSTKKGFQERCKVKISKEGFSDYESSVSVRLGDKDTAILALKTMINQISGTTDGDVPFQEDL